MKNKEKSRGVQLTRRKNKFASTASSSSSTSSWRRFTFKAILLIGFLCIISIYSHLLSRIAIQRRGRSSSNNDKEKMIITGDAMSSSSSSNPSKAVLVIAAVPFHSSRALSLWSQLECFTDNIDKVVIAAADFSKELMDPFIREAVNAIPHLRDGRVKVEVKYYKNDRYDIGLWCDALNDGKGEEKTDTNVGKSLVNNFDHFMLINDSLMAIQRSSELIDVTRSKKIKMGSLTYSLLGGRYWLEANYRSFDSDGMKTFMEHVCIPNPCLEKRGKKRQHRCMVDKFEIPVASFFRRDEVWGLYHGDATIEYFNATRKNKKLQTR